MIRLCVALAAAGAACHIMAMLAPGNPPLATNAVILNAVMLGLIALCLKCSLSLWRRPTDRSATAMLVVTAVMLVAHPVLALGGHHHAARLSGWPLFSGWPLCSGWPLFSAVAFALDAALLFSLAAWLRHLHTEHVPETEEALKTTVR